MRQGTEQKGFHLPRLSQHLCSARALKYCPVPSRSPGAAGGQSLAGSVLCEGRGVRGTGDGVVRRRGGSHEQPKGDSSDGPGCEGRRCRRVPAPRRSPRSRPPCAAAAAAIGSRAEPSPAQPPVPLRRHRHELLVVSNRGRGGRGAAAPGPSPRLPSSPPASPAPAARCLCAPLTAAAGPSRPGGPEAAAGRRGQPSWGKHPSSGACSVFNFNLYVVICTQKSGSKLIPGSGCPAKDRWQGGWR